MQVTPTSLNFLFTEFKRQYDLGFAKRAIMWPRIAERISSSSETNTYGWLAEIPGFREWIGPRVFHNLAARAYSIANKSWEDGFTVSKDKIDDDQFGIYARHAFLLGDAAAKLWDDLVFDCLQAGGAKVGHDGQFFFDNDHPVNLDDDAAGVYQNNYVSRPLTVENLFYLRARMMGFKGESGRALEIVPDLLIVPPALEQAALEATAPVVVSGGAGAVIPNALLGSQLKPKLEVLTVPRLENQPETYYLASTTLLKPIILQVRKEPVIVQRTEPSLDPAFYRKEYEYGADARGAAGYGLPFTIIRAKTTS